MTAQSSLALIRWYQRRVSPLFPARCKYYPTCSAYAAIAIKRFGFVRGAALGLLRLLRCQPWVDGGIDDVPRKFSLFYRFTWSKAHEEPTTEAVLAQDRLQSHVDRNSTEPSHAGQPNPAPPHARAHAYAHSEFSSIDISHQELAHQ
jgi:putative membrane protein insertion efficiency factor